MSVKEMDLMHKTGLKLEAALDASGLDWKQCNVIYVHEGIARQLQVEPREAKPSNDLDLRDDDSPMPMKIEKAFDHIQDVAERKTEPEPCTVEGCRFIGTQHFGTHLIERKAKQQTEKSK